MSAREADVHNGRARAALEDLVRSECAREISRKFLKWFAELRALRSARSLLGDQADFLERPSGSGGPLEYEVQCAVSDLMDENGVTAEDLEKEAVDSLCRSIRSRLESYIRAFEAEVHANGNLDVRQPVKQMRQLVREFDLDAFASNYLLDSQFRASRPGTPPLSLNEDLTRHVRRSEGNGE